MLKQCRFHHPVRCLFVIGILLSPVIYCTSAPGRDGDAAGYSGNPKTIAHDFLDMEAPFGAGAEHRAAVDRLINRAMGAVSPAPRYTTEEAVRTLRAIHALLENEGFTTSNNLLLCRGLERKKIDCDNYCAIYIAIAEVLNIPLVPVYAPNHSFLRFCFDDGTYINWEPTEARVDPDAYYVSELRIPAESIRKGVYMKILSRGEFIGVEYNNIGAHLMTGRRYAEAVPYFSLAIREYPRFSSAYHNRGTAYYAVRRLDEALADLTEAAGLDPSRATTRNTLGDVLFDLKEYGRALREYTASIRLDPTNYVPYNSIGLIMKVQKKDDQAETWFARSREIRAKYGK
ncbi:MAG: tetratricopeptide repeat protein [Spirochaetes bacterium]|nr:tetratricopeptide repeat protein [Spirochaetota bacterium]